MIVADGIPVGSRWVPLASACEREGKGTWKNSDHLFAGTIGKGLKVDFAICLEEDAFAGWLRGWATICVAGLLSLICRNLVSGVREDARALRRVPRRDRRARGAEGAAL